MNDVVAFRDQLLECAKHGRVIVVDTTRTGSVCRARGKVVSVNLTHFVLSWKTGECILPIGAVIHLERALADHE